MLKRLAGFGLVVALLLPLLPSQAGAQQQEKAPTVALRIRSFDDVMAAVKIIAKTAGKEEFGKQLEALIQLQVGPQGLKGIDTSRPIGVYGRMGGDLNQTSAVLMIPIKNQKQFLDLLARLNFPARKNANGVYIVQQELAPVEIGFRFAHGYAYATALNLEAIAPNALLQPAQVFPKGAKGLVTGSLRLDQVPLTLRKIAVSKMEEALAEEKTKPAKTEQERRVRNAMIDEMGRAMADFILGAKEVAFSVDINANQATASFSVSAIPNTAFDKQLRTLAETKSIFGSLVTQSQGAVVTTHIRLPEKTRKVVAKIIDQGFRKAIERERSDEKRQQAELAYRTLGPTLKSGELDAAVAVHPHKSGQATIVAGVKVVKGKKIDDVLKAIYVLLPERDQAKIKLNVVKVNGVPVHQLNVQGEYDEKARTLLGDSPLYVAIRDDAVIAAVGPNALPTLKKLVAMPPRPAPVFHAAVRVADFIPLLDDDLQKQIARQVFKGGKTGAVRLTVGSGKRMEASIVIDLSVFEFVARAIERSSEIGLRPQAAGIGSDNR